MNGIQNINPHPHPLVRDGKSQNGRSNPDLNPEDVKIDGRSWGDILTYIFELSRHINFFDEQMSREGDWQDFFRMSGPVRLSIIQNLEIAEQIKDYNQASDQYFNGVDRGNPKPLFDRQFEVALMVHDWYVELIDEPSGFCKEIEKLIFTNLQFGLHRLIALSFSEPVLDAGYVDSYYIQHLKTESKKYNNIWALDIEILPEVIPFGSRNQQRKELEKRLKETFQVFYRGLEYLQTKVPAFFTKSLAIPVPTDDGNGQAQADSFQGHEPLLGLLFSFLKLFDQLKGNLNEHAKNHLEFYYKKVLNLTEKASIPDEAHLVFEVADSLPEHVLKENILFSAGEDKNGVDQQFKLDKELFVQRARVTEMRTLFFDKNEVQKVVDGKKGPFSIIKGAVAAPNAKSADGLGADFAGIDPPSWPTLGRKNSLLTDFGKPEELLPYPDARLGLALAAPILVLQEGFRKVAIQLVCDLPSYLQNVNGRDYKSLKQAIDTLFYLTPKSVAVLIEGGFDPQLEVPNLIYNYGSLPKRVDGFRRFMEVNNIAGERRSVFEKSIERRLAFNIALSGEGEWIYPHEVDMSLTQNANGQAVLGINIQLGLEDPAVISFNADAFGFDLGTKAPVCKLELEPNLLFEVEIEDDHQGNGKEEVSIYHAFREMTLADISLVVEVKGVHDLVVQSVDGVLDPGSAFEPFGAEPNKRKDFYVGSQEVFHKKLSSTDDHPGLKLHLSWDNLPGSFFDHYRMYDFESVLRNEYLGSMRILYQGNWIPLDPQRPEKTLFTQLNFIALEPSAEGFNYEVRDGAELVLKVLEKNSNSPSSRIDLGNVLFLAMDENKYLRENNSTGDSYRFDIYSKDDHTADSRAAETKYFPNAISEEEAIAEIISILTRPEITLEARDFGEMRATSVSEQFALTTETRNGFMSLQLLDSDFFHKQFPKVFSIQSTAQALALQIEAIKMNAEVQATNGTPVITLPPQVNQAIFRSNTDPIDVKLGVALNEDEYKNYLAELPNDPFSPALNAISIDYRAEAGVFDLDAFHLFPYEEANVLELDLNRTVPTLLPKFEDEEGDVTSEKQGNLFIGLEDLSPGNTLALLIQVAEATADPDLERAAISWHYLRDNQWVRLEPDAQVLSDGTDGLIRSGIVELAIPYDINRNNTILPSGQFWIKVSTPKRSAATSHTIDIHPQSSKVTFVALEGNDLDRLSNQLPKESIVEFVNETPAVKSLLQPYQSFGGNPKEKEDSFYNRVSEHLRHKGRAITLYDYERILLEAFPEIFRLKCVTHTRGRKGEDFDFELAPMHVTVAVIPDLRQQDYADRLEPKFSVGALLEMGKYLRQYCSPFVQLQVLNPRYEQVTIEAKVKFKVGKSPEFYRQELKHAILNFLSPWASDEFDRISFGGEIFGSYLLNFMEQREYIDYITDFVMKDDKGREVQEVTTRSTRSILVSGQHTIQIIP